jgi:DNA modification methylase
MLRNKNALNDLGGNICMEQDYLIKLRNICNKKPEKEKGFTRDYYSYPAKFLSFLPHYLILNFSNKYDNIFDPFSGGGTVGLESLLLSRNFVGYDINPLAFLISKVKTTKLDTEKLRNYLDIIIQSKNKGEIKRNIVDNEDQIVLGSQISSEINELVNNIESFVDDVKYQEFFKLGLIHSIKIVGRRDFDQKTELGKNQLSMDNFTSKKNQPTDSKQFAQVQLSIMPIFKRKSLDMIQSMALLPKNADLSIKFNHESNFQVKLPNNSVDLIITSPPYKDLDIEYLEIQIQRPEMHRAKRSYLVTTILNTPIVEKDRLCGFTKDKYWENIKPSLIECYRVLKSNKFAFFWIGFKSEEEKDQFSLILKSIGFEIKDIIKVELSDNRAASSRSTHHGKETNMMDYDWLYVAYKI